MLLSIGRYAAKLPSFSRPIPLQILRCFTQSRQALMPDVVVPPLGESVSEGTISTLLKKEGDSIQVDDVVAQLETDKVTIDCKSPHQGVVQSLKVKVGDTVVPGTVLITVTAGNPAPTPSPSTPVPSASPAAGTAPSAPSSTQVPPPTPAEPHTRQPMIRFPPRRLPDGRRISELSPSEAAVALASQAPQHPDPSPAHPTQPPVSSSPPRAQAPMTSLQPPGSKATKMPMAPGPPVSSQTTRLTEAPPRKGMSAKEMEAINLGGLW